MALAQARTKDFKETNFQVPVAGLSPNVHACMHASGCYDETLDAEPNTYYFRLTHGLAFADHEGSAAAGGRRCPLGQRRGRGQRGCLGSLGRRQAGRQQGEKAVGWQGGSGVALLS